MSVVRKNALAITALACVLVTLAYLLFGLTAAMPPDGAWIVYPFTLAYNYTALPVSIVVLLAALTVLFFWLPQALVRRPAYRRDGVLVALALAAMVSFIWVAWPLGSVIYRELDSVSAHGRRYHLGVRASARPEQNAYVLCEAEGWLAWCRHLKDESLATLDPLPVLIVDPVTQVVTVQVADRVLYEAKP